MLFIVTLYKGLLFMTLSILLYSVGVNLISIEIRKELFAGMSIVVPVLSLAAIFFYYLFLSLGNGFLHQHPFLFIFIMYLLASVPVAVLKLYKSKAFTVSFNAQS
jgi:hypothetical protein